MRILGLDTSTDAASAAVMRDGVLEGQIFLHLPKKHSVTLLPSLERLLADLSLSMQDMDAVAVTVGPGSFTGVRIGVATASAFAFVLHCPVYEVSTLDALIAMAPLGIAVCALLDARRDQVYVKAQKGTDVVIKESAQALPEVLESLRGVPQVLFTGDGAVVHQKEIQCVFGDGALFLPEALSYPTAAGACLQAVSGHAVIRTHETIRPVYLRKPQAQRALEDRRKREADDKTPDENTQSIT